MDLQLLIQALLNIPYQLGCDYVDSGVIDEFIGFIGSIVYSKLVNLILEL